MNSASVKTYKKDHVLIVDDNMESLLCDTRSDSLRLSECVSVLYFCVHSGKYAALLLTLLYPQATRQFADKHRPLLQPQSLYRTSLSIFQLRSAACQGVMGPELASHYSKAPAPPNVNHN